MADAAQTADTQTIEDAAEDPRTLYLIDGSAFIFRAFHAMQMLTRPDGTPVNAVYGFCTMMIRLFETFGNGQFAVIFDAARENFRNAIYADYKANRSDPPEELVPQFALIRDATRAFGLPSIEREGFEADDLIATYARLAHANGRRTVIVSSDKDLMQLIRPDVTMWDPMKQVHVGPDQVVEKFGVGPDKVVDVQALAGDSVDNVPGVPGIGIKTAAQLIQDYGDLDSLLAQADGIKQTKRRENLIAFADQARISRRLVALDDQVDVSLEDLAQPFLDLGRLKPFLREQGFTSILTRLDSKIADGAFRDIPYKDDDDGSGAPAPAADGLAVNAADGSADHDQPVRPGAVPQVPDDVTYNLVTDLETLDAWIAEAFQARAIGIDTETDSLRAATATLVGISLATAPGRACYIPVNHRPGEGSLDFSDAQDGTAQLDEATVLERMRPLLTDPGILKVAHNLKYDWQIFAARGIEVGPLDDTMLLSYVLEGRKHEQSLDALSKLYLNHTNIAYSSVVGKGKDQVTFDKVSPEDARDYAAEDADMTLRLHRIFRPRLVFDRMTTVYERLERPLVPVIARMEQAGIQVDRQTLARMSGKFAEQIAALETEVHALAGRSFSIGSPKQLGQVLFDEMGLPVAGKTAGGAYSTASDVLEPLAAEGHEIVGKVLEWRQLSKLQSTYTDALQNEIDPKTGRVHTSFSMAVTNTGRLSSSDPNLQNIPIRTEEGKRIRTAFVAPEGHTLLSIDYSQIELRLVAAIADVEQLKQAFVDGIDIHALTASQMFNVPLDQMTPDLRRQAKAINFGIIYGISGYGLARNLGIDQKEAAAFIKDYLNRFHEIQTYMQAMREFCAEHQYVETLFGRRCFIPEIKDKNRNRRNFAERQAINAPIQGTAADIIKRAMIRIDQALMQSKLQTRMLLQVHDELIFEAPDAEADDAAALIKEIMEAAGGDRLDVPLVAEVGRGSNWADAH